MVPTVRRVALAAVSAVALAGCAHSPATPGPAVATPPVTAAIRAGLVAAGAASHGLPASDFTGLDPGRTFYATDATTGRDYAAAGLLASPSSLRAQVSTQDDGGYNLFVRRSGGAWRVYSDGLGGVPGTACPVSLPAPVVAAWHWAAGTCYPPAS